MKKYAGRAKKTIKKVKLREIRHGKGGGKERGRKSEKEKKGKRNNVKEERTLNAVKINI